MLASFNETMRMIKIEHSIFALPFALVGAVWAADGWPSLRILGLILAAMVLARSAAMAFNRYLDADIDGANPRTAMRSIPAGRLSRGYALGFTIGCAALFILTAYALNSLAFALSPFVLLILLGYSFTKRFTFLCHLVLGLALGLAPFGAWIAVRGSFSWVPIALGVAVLGWTAGFDMIYACQDLAFDRGRGLHSIPARIGIGATLILSRLFHLAMLVVLVLLGYSQGQSWLYWVGLGLVALCLAYEHALVWDGNLEKVDMAFFTMNGLVSLLFGATTIAGVLLL